MSDSNKPSIAIIDYGMGNLFSLKNASLQVGLSPKITSSKEEILSSQAVLLPGVGAFGHAMATLKDLNLIEVLKEIVAEGKLLIGICLGMQLLMTESHEFGNHAGLNFIEGEVIKLPESSKEKNIYKVPQVGWNEIFKPNETSWENSPLKDLKNGEFMYFVHSFYVKPTSQQTILSTTSYAGINFASSLKENNIVACQFHPERSGPQGIRFYQNIANYLKESNNADE